MTKIQRNALRRAACGGINRTGPGWVNARTIDALERKGLIRWSDLQHAYVATLRGRKALR